MKRHPAVLGLALDGRRAEALAVRRTNGSVEAGDGASFVFSADLATGDLAVLGAELRAQLDAAGIRERRCVVGLPLDWAMSLATPLPELPEEDIAAMLQLEAERGFPYPPDALVVAQSRFGQQPGGAGALQLAIPTERVERIEQLLRAAKLVPVSFTLAFPLLVAASAGSPDRAVTLAVGETAVAVAIGSGTGLAALRTIAGALDPSGAAPIARADVVARELRVTLGQVDAGLRSRIERLRIVGTAAAADRLGTELQARAAGMGLVVERVTAANPKALGLGVPPGRALTGALVLATRHLSGKPTGLEFLPPRLSAWQQFTSRHSSKQLAYAGIGVGAVAVAVLLAFGFQQYQLATLGADWTRIEKRVEKVAAMRAQIRRFQPWYDDSFRTLGVLRRLTEAFPEDNSVTAKSIEVRDAGLVVCSGTARDNSALLRTLDRLRSAVGVSEVQVEQVHGKAPQQFTFNFRWDSSARKP
ncbi:MAG: hypothetical protein DVB31_05095 [Verrucomicrobia bacterium]|nr:MAG: hypothetical protein DVB31_05095 [Verrucomicrobiota bacterium]